MEKENKSSGGLLITIILFLAISGVAIYSILNLNDTSKQEEYDLLMQEILKEATEYGKLISDRLSTKCFEITINDLIRNELVIPNKEGKVINPLTNKSMNNKKICLTFENNKITAYEKR